MNDAVDLLRVIKKAATEAVAASAPVAVCFGDVESVEPLQVRLTQRLTLGEGQLIKIKSVEDIDKGDTLLLLRQQGGQAYYILGVV